MIANPSPFRYYNTSPEIIRLAVAPYIRFPCSLRDLAELLFEPGFELCH